MSEFIHYKFAFPNSTPSSISFDFPYEVQKFVLHDSCKISDTFIKREGGVYSPSCSPLIHHSSPPIKCFKIFMLNIFLCINIIEHCTALHCTGLRCAVLCCPVLYCTALLP